jgi:hypothetical protein
VRAAKQSSVRAATKTVVARLDRAIQYAVAARLNTIASGILGRPVEPGDDSGGCANDTIHCKRNDGKRVT